MRLMLQTAYVVDTALGVLRRMRLMAQGVIGGARARKTAISTTAKRLLLKGAFKRFQHLVSHAGASGFELVNPAGRWAPVLSGRVLPFTAAKNL